MPDHAHFVWLGTDAASDQKLAARLFRETWKYELRRGGRELQRQPHDHVLREHECEHGAFAIVAHYVFENPMRAGLVAEWRAYPHLGALVPGFPDLDPRDEDYWEKFWRIYAKVVELRTMGESLTASAAMKANATETKNPSASPQHL
jgi:hypothetical protein